MVQRRFVSQEDEHLAGLETEFTAENWSNSIQIRSLGPGLVTGRIADIKIDPTNPSTWYIASAFGGVWKTTNRGASFTPIFDNYGTHNTCCIEIDPKNSSVLWLGTGENHSQRSAHFGDGLYKSSDAGKTWAPAAISGPVLSKALTRFRMAWRWDGAPVVLMSRAVDETGAIQPTRKALLDARGAAYRYHFHGVQSWRVSADGEVRNVYV